MVAMAEKWQGSRSHPAVMGGWRSVLAQRATRAAAVAGTKGSNRANNRAAVIEELHHRRPARRGPNGGGGRCHPVLQDLQLRRASDRPCRGSPAVLCTRPGPLELVPQQAKFSCDGHG